MCFNAPTDVPLKARAEWYAVPVAAAHSALGTNAAELTVVLSAGKLRQGDFLPL